MSAPAFNRRIWGRPNPARWRAVREAEAAAETAEPAPHGFGETDCAHCDCADRCDCPCATCIDSRRAAAGLSTSEDESPSPSPSPSPKPVSWIQRALDEQWASANFAGPGCPFCDAMFSCDCWARRAEMIEAEHRREERERRATAARGGSTCSEDGSECDYCLHQCKDCGAYPDEPCRPGCGDHGPEHEEDDRTEYGDCSGCYPGCFGCQADFDPSDPWGRRRARGAS